MMIGDFARPESEKQFQHGVRMLDDPELPIDDQDATLGFAAEPDNPAEPERPRAVPVSRKRRKKRRRVKKDHEQEAEKPEHYDRLLDRPDPTDPYWWVAPVVVLSLGALLCLVPIIAVAVKIGVSAGAAVMLGMGVAVILQIIGMVVLLMVVGTLFGIDYGPVWEALLKLAAVMTVIDGLTGTFAMCNAPTALAAAAILGAGVFQYLFRLDIHETLLSVAGMVFFSFLLNAVVFAYIFAHAQ